MGLLLESRVFVCVRPQLQLPELKRVGKKERRADGRKGAHSSHCEARAGLGAGSPTYTPLDTPLFVTVPLPFLSLEILQGAGKIAQWLKVLTALPEFNT